MEIIESIPTSKYTSSDIDLCLIHEHELVINFKKIMRKCMYWL